MLAHCIRAGWSRFSRALAPLGAALLLLATASAGHAQSLTTLFASDNGFAGNTFDLTVLNPAGVTITGFDVNLDNPGTAGQVSVYYKAGTSVGFETNMAAWTLMGTDPNVVSQGTDNPTPVDAGSLSLAPGTYGFYVFLDSHPSSIFRYTNGGPTTYANTDLSLTTQTGQGGPAFSNSFVPREWNGTIHYFVNCPCFPAGSLSGAPIFGACRALGPWSGQYTEYTAWPLFYARSWQGYCQYQSLSGGGQAQQPLTPAESQNCRQALTTAAAAAGVTCQQY